MNSLTHRERILLTLERREPDCVPFDCTFTIGAYRALIDNLGLPSEEPLRPTQWMELRPSPALADALDLDICYVDPGRPSGAPEFTLGMDHFTDEWGMNFKKVELADGNLYYALVDPPLAHATQADLAAYPWPDPADPGWVEGLAERAKAGQKSGRAVFLELPISIFEYAWYLRGLEQFYIDLVTDPPFATALMDRLCNLAIGVARAALREAGEHIDVVKHLDDVGSQHGPLLSPKMFRELIRPRFERLFHAIQAEFARCNPRGKVMTHSDGDVYPFIEDYIAAGIDILNPVQPRVAEMEHSRLKREFGHRIVFHGGVDVQGVMPFGTPEEVAAEARQRIHDLAPGGGYVLAPSHNLQHDVPPANVLALRDAVREYGRYPLQL